MKLIRLPMGCLSSRSTIAPTSARVESKDLKSEHTNGQQVDDDRLQAVKNSNPSSSVEVNENTQLKSEYITRMQGKSNRKSINQSHTESTDEDIMSILMIDQNNSKSTGQRQDANKNEIISDNREVLDNGKDEDDNLFKSNQDSLNQEEDDEEDENEDENKNENENEDNGTVKKLATSGGNDNVGVTGEEDDLDLLRQYMAVDYEITILEDKDALRVYHEKIEQLEQLERELDLISSEAEEVATRGDKSGQIKRMTSTGGSKLDTENNSIMSGVTGSLSHRSWTPNELQANEIPSSAKDKTRANNSTRDSNQDGNKFSGSSKKGTSTVVSQLLGSNRQLNNLSYSTVEEVFNRKIILEKERDKLKKEVEMVIIECDKLQQRYKRRDEILDKLFDGRTGNGLENHLEQQLNWLLEQKHYVDQVFYVWKRAETLTSQTCEQFASALELLKRLPKVDEPEQRAELVKSIGSLLVKSRQGMEQAQKYNPNVDTPFFTDNETERFDNIIEKITSNSISQTEYSQILTVIQFAYKRAVSIRLWLEQILQTTIARDSFELAEEYKWIAIQLRKERINLIKSKLQYSPYQSMAQELHEQMARQQSMAEKRQHEVNRDSGIESETNDIDIEEEIYRLLELNKSRLEAAGTGTGTGTARASNESGTGTSAKLMMSNGAKPINSQLSKQHSHHHHHHNQQQLKAMDQNMVATTSASSFDSQHRDQMMRDRIQKRAKGEQPMQLIAKLPSAPIIPDNYEDSSSTGSNTKLEQQQQQSRPGSLTNGINPSETSNISIGTPTKLKVELDEAAKQNLLKQVDQIHSRHKSKIERLRGSNRAKATSSIMNRMQNAREDHQNQQHKPARTGD